MPFYLRQLVIVRQNVKTPSSVMNRLNEQLGMHVTSYSVIWYSMRTLT